MAFDIGDYNDVPARIRDFREKHPEGSLQPANPERPYDVLTISDKTFIVYAAAAYRSPDDPRPGIGLAYEPFPGRTPYTRDSELQNAETSAWGRAIVAALAADVKKIATAEDVRNRQDAGTGDAAPADAPPVPRPANTTKSVDELRGVVAEIKTEWQRLGLSEDDGKADLARVHPGVTPQTATVTQLRAYRATLRNRRPEPAEALV